MSGNTQAVIQVFYCYAPADKNLLTGLENQLAPLKHINAIAGWSDREVLAGTHRDQIVQSYLDYSDLILLLISPDFLSVDFCYSLEMGHALDRHTKGEAVILPIILRPVMWGITEIRHLQALPRNNKPVTTWSNRDAAFYDVAVGITKVVKKLAEKHRKRFIEKYMADAESEARLNSISWIPTDPFRAEKRADAEDLYKNIYDKLKSVQMEINQQGLFLQQYIDSMVQDETDPEEGEQSIHAMEQAFAQETSSVSEEHESSLAIDEKQLGPQHPDTAGILYNLALLYDAQGKYEQAEPLYQRSLAIREQQLGPQHPDTVTSLIMLAKLYYVQGKYAQAEPLYMRVLAIQEQQLGAQHPDTASSLNNLAGLYHNQGKYAEAEPLYMRALAIREQQLGPEHPDTAASLNNLVVHYRDQGKYAQADAYLQEGLTIARQSGHLERISALLNTLGSVAASQGNYPLSETYQREGLATARQSGDREQICGLLLNMGVTAAAQGHDEQAETYMQEALLLARQIGHLEWTISLLLNMGEMSDDQGQYAQAGSYYAEALALARKAAQREWISIILTNMGKLAVKQDNYGKAGTYLLESLELAQQIKRPRVICICLYEHGNLYLKQELLDAAESAFSGMLTDIPAGDRELLALAHYGLARVAVARGNVQEGRELGEQSVKALEAIGHRRAREVKNWLTSLQ